MAANNGKRFEKNIKDSCEKQGILWERFIDGNKWGGGNAESIRFTPDSPCDGLLFDKGHLIYVELKTAQTGSISFNQPPYIQPKGKQKPSIKAHQVKSLFDRVKYPGVNAGLLVEFSDRTTKTQTIVGGTFYIDIEKFIRWAAECGKKSMNINDARSIGIGIESRTMIKNKRYDMAGMITKIKREE